MVPSDDDENRFLATAAAAVTCVDRATRRANADEAASGAARPTEVQLVTRSGETQSAFVLSSPGDPELALTAHEVIGKFERLVSNVVRQPESILRAGKASQSERKDMPRLMESVEGALREAGQV